MIWQSIVYVCGPNVSTLDQQLMRPWLSLNVISISLISSYPNVILTFSCAPLMRIEHRVVLDISHWDWITLSTVIGLHLDSDSLVLRIAVLSQFANRFNVCVWVINFDFRSVVTHHLALFVYGCQSSNRLICYCCMKTYWKF